MTEQKIEEFWRDATAEDVARVMKGEKVEARFRDGEGTSWCLRKLIGWNTGLFRCDRAEGWKQCQVYEPQQWWLDKPDPGEGYRLLEKFPDEPKLATDEVWDCHPREWRKIFTNDDDQVKTAWYRRRIEPEKVASRSKDYIPNGWIKLSDDEPRLASDAYWSQGASEWCLIGEDRVNFANRSKWPAIRQAFNQMRTLLVADCCYCLPNGQKIRTTEKGFEVL